MALLDTVPASWDEYVAGGGGRGLEVALSAPPEAVIDEVAKSGLRGRGGAGFPTADKWRAVRTGGEGPRFAVCNAAEGEPATFKDRMLLRTNPYQVLEGLLIAAHVIGAQTAFFGIKETFTREIQRVTTALDEMAQAGALGGLAVQVVLGPDAYLFGEETGLEEVIEGKQPLPRQLAPYILGLFAPPGDNPTAMNNVETLALAAHVVADGADWLRQWGTDDSPGTMCFTLTGDVRHEGVYELPLGTPMRELVEERGGGPPEGRAVKAIFPGASSTILTREQLDTPLDFESMRAVGSGLGAGGFAVYDESACVVHLTHLFSRFLSIESCGQCPACKLNSGEITERLALLDRGQGGPDDVETILAMALKVTDGQKCALPTGETLIVQSAVQLFPEEFRAHAGGPCAKRRDLRLPKLVDWDEVAGRFTYDERYERKRPDWTYAA